MAMSSKGVSDVYVHKSKQAIRQNTYLEQCINKRLLPFIEKYHQDGNYLFWPDLASSHYSKSVQDRLNEKMYHLCFVQIILQTYHKLVQLKHFGLYSNDEYMRTTGKQKPWMF